MATKTKTESKTVTTKKPSGLTTSRKKLKFILTWKIVDANHGKGQELQWRTNRMKKNKWKSVTVGKTATSATIALKQEDCYPTDGKKPVTEITFRVRGKRSPDSTVTTTRNGSDTTETTTNYTYNWSKWAEHAYKLHPHAKPTLTPSWDSSHTNQADFAWATTVSDDDAYPYSSVKWESIVVANSNETNGAKLTWKTSNVGWQTGTSAATGGTITIPESVDLTAAAYTRWVRIRSRGIGGASDWRYAKHVYSTPYKPKNLKAKIESVSGGNTTVKMSWEIASNASHPIDQVSVQWYIGTPAAGRACPDANFTTALTMADTDGTNTARFVISNRTVGADECLWVKIQALHDANTNTSSPLLVQSGSLTAPSGVTVTADAYTAMATVEAVNESDVPDSKLAVIFRKEGQADYVCGIMDGESSVDVRCAPWGTAEISFGVYAFQGSYTSSQRADGTTQYAVTANMRSSTVWQGGSVPVAPANVTATISRVGEVLLTWAWSWSSANRAEVSWSQNQYAWESTDGPETYLLESIHAAKLRVSDLETGITWYFRVRLAQQDGTDLTYGPYSDTQAVTLSTAPEKPAFAISDAIIARGKKISATWTFESTDGTTQAYAEIWTATVSGSTVTPVARVISTTTAKTCQIPVTWANGTAVNLICRVTSTGGLHSEWSDPVTLHVATPPTCTITQTSLAWVEIPLIYPAADLYPESSTDLVYPSDGRLDGGEDILTAMPLTVTVTGAGAGGITTLAIERSVAYQMDRPDEDVFNGYEGETIAVLTQTGEAQITVTDEDLIGLLDDGARYRIVATVTDGLGQSASAEQKFIVMWAHQAIIPEATVTVDEGNMVAMITPTAPEGTQTGDVCDIYRLSADKPELIVSGGAWGETYVDPYPAFGTCGGHRVVFRSVNGDYITADNHPAWIDLQQPEGDTLDMAYAVIDFDRGRVALEYNIALSNAWQKDFQETKYLGGAVQGDWNPAVSRTGTISTVVIAASDLETITAMRRLATHAGICHVRTPDGSSFAADVEVSENRSYDRTGDWVDFNLSVTRVDPEGLDGVTYAQWITD